jgi:peptide/nickel transport system permease protein
MASMTTGEPKPQKLKEPGTHILGTDGTGQDVLYRTLKGARTAFIIGGLTSLIATPLALLFGLAAGYYGKGVDDGIQYLYSVLASIPSILLQIALVLVLGKGIFQICIALGITSWVGLCRLTRGETLKHRDREYVRAAKALGVSDFRLLTRHILPNLLPVIIITVTLGFSGLILSESILSYLGIGVDADMGSWGNMIDAARDELARDPVIWWNITSASVALFILVLAFNLLGDALRDAVDPVCGAKSVLGKFFVLLEVLVFLTCFCAPLVSLWLAPDWTGLIAIACLFVSLRVRVTLFLSLGDFLILVSALSTFVIWLFRLASTQ